MKTGVGNDRRNIMSNERALDLTVKVSKSGIFSVYILEPESGATFQKDFLFNQKKSSKLQRRNQQRDL